MFASIAARSAIAYVKAACAERSAFLHALKTYVTFGKGWSRRVADVEATGIKMAVGAQGAPQAPVLQKEAKAAKKKAVAHGTAAAGAAAAPVAHNALPSVHHTDPSTTAGLIFLGIAGAIAVTYFVGHLIGGHGLQCFFNRCVTTMGAVNFQRVNVGDFVVMDQ